MSRASRSLALAVLSLLAVSCYSTKMISSWKDPNAQQLQFKKVLALFMSKDESMRRAAEDEMVRQIKKAEAVAAYTILPTEKLGDQEGAKARVKEGGFDGAVIMRLVSEKQETTWVPGSYPAPYYSMWGYYGYGYGVAYDPGYMRTDTIVRIETNVYSVNDEKLLWSGLSETFNPTGPRQLVEGIAIAVSDRLKEEGLLPR